jgi:hypothetical protein
MRARPSIPIELVRCIAEDRAPTDREMLSVARHIWLDRTVRPSPHGWAQLPPDAPHRLAAFRLARSALYGTPDMRCADA